MNQIYTESSLRGRIDRILPRVAKPARYMGGELNSIKKPPEEVSVRIALAFPDVYEVGMSNLGLRILYSVLNKEPGVAAERTFAPASDMEEEMRRASIPLFSLETSSPVRDFDLVGFSLAYEMAYTAVLNMLDLASIPVLASDRTDADPIVIAGGHCTTNPEPMADFIDAFVVGDGEEAVVEIARAVESAEWRAKRGKADSSQARNDVLALLAAIDGVYVPSPAESREADSSQARNDVVRARVVRDLEAAPFPESLIVPYTEAVHDRVALEIMRGCTRGCRFCQAGMITRPVRERSMDKLLEQARTLLDNTGYEEIALTSLSSADHSQIDDLVRALMDEHERNKVGISLPSLRADAKCVQLAAEIQRVRKSGLTFAPEAGTQRLRDVINKNVTEEDLLAAVEAAVEHGWKRVKLYFMIGLPTETDEDIQGIADLVWKVIGVGREHRVSLAVSVTISPFVPKPQTPFQWRGMASIEELERRIAMLRPLLPRKNVNLSWHDPKCSRVEAALARGDRSLGRVIYEAWRHTPPTPPLAKGGTAGGSPQDRVDNDRWAAAFEAAGVDIASYANADIPRDAALPWDHIDVGVSKKFLAREDAKADEGKSTPDCRNGLCSGCGVACSGEKGREPLPSPPLEREGADRAALNSQLSTLNSVPVLFTFGKTAELKWLGHLDMMRVFERAVRMSGVEVAYTQGFNPRVKMSIASALPLGATADNELVTIHLAGNVDPKDALIRLNKRLPEGLKLTSARVLNRARELSVYASEFVVECGMQNAESDMAELRAAVDELLARERIPWVRESGGKRREVDLRPGIARLQVDEGTSAQLRMVVEHREFTVKPSEVVALLAERVPGLEAISVHRERLIV